jgi:hypothetical protein
MVSENKVNYEDLEQFSADKYMRSLGANSLVADVEMKMIYFEEKAFNLVMSAFFFSLIIVILNFFW